MIDAPRSCYSFSLSVAIESDRILFDRTTETAISKSFAFSPYFVRISFSLSIKKRVKNAFELCKR